MTKQPWTPGIATEKIRAIANDPRLTIAYKLHANERLDERNLIVSDVLFALKNGFVYQEPIPATRDGFYRYRVESQTPNSGSRSIGVVVIPNHTGCYLKIVTVMWIDEFERRDGSIIGE